MIVGADIGRNNTKIVTSSKTMCFRTLCKLEQQQGYENSDAIIIDNNRYAIGQGTGIVNDNKAFDTTFKICLLYALSKLDSIDFQVVVGLPISHFKLYHKDIIDSFNKKTFYLRTETDGKIKSKQIIIDEITVVPEGILCSTDTTSDNILVDIGGGTVDVALFEEGKLMKASSYPLGVKTMYSYISQELKKLGSDCNEGKVQDYVRRGSYILNNKVVNFDSLLYKKQHIDKIIESIKNDFPWNSTTKTFIGGGSCVFSDLLLESGIVPVENSLYSNANAFKKYGEALWQKR